MTDERLANALMQHANFFHEQKRSVAAQVCIKSAMRLRELSKQAKAWNTRAHPNPTNEGGVRE